MNIVIVYTVILALTVSLFIISFFCRVPRIFCYRCIPGLAACLSLFMLMSLKIFTRSLFPSLSNTYNTVTFLIIPVYFVINYKLVIPKVAYCPFSLASAIHFDNSLLSLLTFSVKSWCTAKPLFLFSFSLHFCKTL